MCESSRIDVEIVRTGFYLVVGATILGMLLASCGGSGGGTTPKDAASSEPTKQSPREVLMKVGCYEPRPDDWRLQTASPCARLEKVKHVRRNVWWAQLRGRFVYCLRVKMNVNMKSKPGYPGPDPAAIFPGIGYVEEIGCPASAYADEPKPDVRVTLGGGDSESRLLHRKYGIVELTSVGPRRTRVVVEAGMDRAWISPGTCDRPSRRGSSFSLSMDFFSFRAVTVLRVPLRELVNKPHALYTDAGGAHGGVPLGCANLGASPN
jgi:hypothetical protein